MSRIRPYEHLSDPELRQLTQEAADLQIRMMTASPGDLIACLKDNGMPATAAVTQVLDPMGRIFAAKFKIDVEEADRGDKQAKARVESVREAWAAMRKRER